MGFKWPDYASIFAENVDNDMLKNSKYCLKNISISIALFFHPQIRPLNAHVFLPSGLNYSAYYDAYLVSKEPQAF